MRIYGQKVCQGSCPSMAQTNQICLMQSEQLIQTSLNSKLRCHARMKQQTRVTQDFANNKPG
jgi:hypothetical protein